MKMILSNEDKNRIIQLICNEQIHQHIKHPDFYETDDYSELEKLKVKIKEL